MADSAAACFKKTVVKLRYIPPFRSDEDEPADCTTVKLMGQPNIVLPPPAGMM